MGWMFRNCSLLREINLGNNDFKNVTQQDEALSGVGTVESPCVLIIGPEFDKSVLGELHTGTTSYYSWLGGYVNLDFNDATGIDNASVRPSAGSGRVYSLGGQLVSTRGTGQLPKGIYIVDGKKIAVK